MSPKETDYIDLNGPEWDELRAGAIAHTIRLGKRPPVGQFVGFSLQLKAADVKDHTNIQPIELETATNLSPKIWCSFNTTQLDIDNAIKLINGQKITYREPKISQMSLEDLRPKRQPSEDS